MPYSDQEKKNFTRLVENYEGLSAAQRVDAGTATKAQLDAAAFDPWSDAWPVASDTPGGAFLIKAAGGWDRFGALDRRFRASRSAAYLEAGRGASGQTVSPDAKPESVAGAALEGFVEGLPQGFGDVQELLKKVAIGAAVVLGVVVVLEVVR